MTKSAKAVLIIFVLIFGFTLGIVIHELFTGVIGNLIATLIVWGTGDAAITIFKKH